MMHEAPAAVVRRHAAVLDAETAPGRLLDAIDPAASLVLIGEATHGTHEFYRIRADLTRALVERRGFDVVAVEADWPDAYRANRSRALEPLEKWARHEIDLPETYPTGV